MTEYTSSPDREEVICQPQSDDSSGDKVAAPISAEIDIIKARTNSAETDLYKLLFPMADTVDLNEIASRLSKENIEFSLKKDGLGEIFQRSPGKAKKIVQVVRDIRRTLGGDAKFYLDVDNELDPKDPDLDLYVRQKNYIDGLIQILGGISQKYKINWLSIVTDLKEV